MAAKDSTKKEEAALGEYPHEQQQFLYYSLPLPRSGYKGLETFPWEETRKAVFLRMWTICGRI